MSSMLRNILLLAACFCLFSGTAHAQSSTPIACNVSQAMQLSQTQFQGEWFEVARNPAPSPVVSCVGLNVFQANGQSKVNTTFASNPNKLLSNQTTTSNVTMLSPTLAVFNLTSATGSGSSGSNPKNVTVKVLYTDYTNVTYICGYTNATDNSTSFGLILTRDRLVNSTTLSNYKKTAAQSWVNFASDMPNITQNKKCTNAASAHMPTMLSALFALIYALYKYIE